MNPNAIYAIKQVIQKLLKQNSLIFSFNYYRLEQLNQFSSWFHSPTIKVQLCSFSYVQLEQLNQSSSWFQSPIMRLFCQLGSFSYDQLEHCSWIRLQVDSLLPLWDWYFTFAASWNACWIMFMRFWCTCKDHLHNISTVTLCRDLSGQHGYLGNQCNKCEILTVF